MSSRPNADRPLDQVSYLSLVTGVGLTADGRTACPPIRPATCGGVEVSDTTIAPFWPRRTDVTVPIPPPGHDSDLPG